jgi:DNA-binding MarR family transcriptional regulator
MDTTFDRRRWRGGSVYAADFRPLDRNQRAKILFLAEALDRRTKQPGRHGGVLGRTGLAVLRTLVTQFLNSATGRLDPSIATIAKAANMARSTAQAALDRLELAGIIDRVRRMARTRMKVWNAAAGRHLITDRVLQITNAYRLNFALPDRREHGDLARPLFRELVTDTGKRSETTSLFKSTTTIADLPPGRLREALERLGKSIGRCSGDEEKEAHGKGGVE